MQTETLFKLEYTVSRDERDTATAIITAAGSSTRLGGTDKILADLCGRPVLEYSLRAFCDHKGIDSVTVVASAENILEIQKICAKYPKVTDVVVGGKCREESVAAGFARVRSKFVLIHDGARPLVSAAVIDRVLAGLKNCAAVAPAVHLSDTVKTVDPNGAVIQTLSRADLRAVQTPQGFDAEVFGNALEKAGSLSRYTDDCSIVENAGVQVMCVEGDTKNIKITEDTDLKIAAVLLGGRQP